MSGAVWLIDEIAERRIAEAIERGELDGVGPRGRIELDDDALVPEEMRLALRVLRNAGWLPEEVRLRREIADVEALLATLAPAERDRAGRRLALLRTRLAARGRELPLHMSAAYEARLTARLADSSTASARSPKTLSQGAFSGPGV